VDKTPKYRIVDKGAAKTHRFYVQERVLFFWSTVYRAGTLAKAEELVRELSRKRKTIVVFDQDGNRLE
jgi:hypothetical protein